MPQTTTGSPGAAPTASRCDCSTVGEAKLACRHHALVAAPFPEDVAGPVDEPKPKTARAPIDRDICSLLHFNSVPNACHPRLGTSYHAGLPGSYARQRSLCN